MEIAVVGLAIFGTLATIQGLRFRRGTDQSLMGLYRNAGIPVIFRNLALVVPFAGALILVLIALAAGRYFQLWGEPSVVVDGVFAIFMIELALCGSALLLALAFWAPSWLIPAWLRDDEDLVGYVPPKHGWEDRIWLLIAGGIVAIGVAFLAVVISLLPPSLT
jgi:hypothetical protein